MQVKVLLFASLAQRLGVRELTLALPEAATVAIALDHVQALHPPFASLRAGVTPAVNLAYVGVAEVLRDGDELALIPPVSGG